MTVEGERQYVLHVADVKGLLEEFNKVARSINMTKMEMMFWQTKTLQNVLRM